MKQTFLIVGLGSIGKRHLECLRAIRPEAEIIIWRQFNKDSELPQGADAIVFDLEAALKVRPIAAIISNPAPLHVETGVALADNGVHLLIEKPLSHSLDGIDQLLATCKVRGSVLMVAYVLRFNESLRCFATAIRDQLIGRIVSVRSEAGQYLPDWRPGTDYRQSVSARQDLGGGALLELSHEMDYMRWIFGDVLSVRALIAKTGMLDIDTDDLVELTLEIMGHDGHRIISNVHLDMLQREARRFCKAIGEKGTLEWDAVSNNVRYYKADEKCWHTLFENQENPGSSMYSTQLESFLKCVETGGVPVITGDDGRVVIEIIEAARKSSAMNKTEFLS